MQQSEDSWTLDTHPEKPEKTDTAGGGVLTKGSKEIEEGLC